MILDYVLYPKTFDGNYENWVPFYDTYKSLIGNDSDITDIQKFHYLKSSLKGEALKVIDPLPVTNANYGSVLKLLSERYEKKHLIISNHVKSLINIPSLHKESLGGLRQLVNDNHKFKLL